MKALHGLGMDHEYGRPYAGTIAADPVPGESLNSQIVRETAVGLNTNGQLGTTGATTATPAVTGSNTAGAVTLGTTQGTNTAGQLGSSGTTDSATPATTGATSAGTDASSTSGQTNPAMGSGDIAQPVTLSGGASCIQCCKAHAPFLSGVQESPQMAG